MQHRRQAVQARERDSPVVTGWQTRWSSTYLALSACDLRRELDPRPRGCREHERRDRHANSKPPRTRSQYGPRREACHDYGAASITGEMKSAQHLTEHVCRARATIGPESAEHVERGWSSHRSEDRQTADPHDESQQRRVAQRKHQVIIIDRPDVAWCVARRGADGSSMESPVKCGVAWLPWSGAAFARARADHKPVLLSIATAWSLACREMDRTSYADPAVTALVAERFVPVRVDADRRPDISNRYALGGWPTTAFLNADGEILGGGTFVSADRLPLVLQRVLDAFARHDAARIVDRPAAGTPDGSSPSLDAIEALVFDSYDLSFGAFGGPPRFPHVAPVHLALVLARDDPNSRYAQIATTCLDTMGWGALYDEVDGGFFRCAQGADWTRPQSGKLLDVNASLLSLYLDAFETLRLARYAQRAEDLLGFLQQTMADMPDGGWAASQAEAPEYYGLDDVRARAARAAPGIDRTLLSDANACMVSAALRAARVMHDDGLRDFALKSLERVVLRTYKPGAGVAHYVENGQEIRGLLDDQIAMAAAHLDAYDVTEDIVYEMMAEEIARQAIIACRDVQAGGFFDRAAAEDDMGLLRRPMKPFVSNCEAARVLRRLSVVSHDAEFQSLADEALRSVLPAAASQGPLAAHYALAMHEAGVR